MGTSQATFPAVKITSDMQRKSRKTKTEEHCRSQGELQAVREAVHIPGLIGEVSTRFKLPSPSYLELTILRPRKTLQSHKMDGLKGCER
jgi:hypothetical protein